MFYVNLYLHVYKLIVYLMLKKLCAACNRNEKRKQKRKGQETMNKNQNTKDTLP